MKFWCLGFLVFLLQACGQEQNREEMVEETKEAIVQEESNLIASLVDRAARVQLFLYCPNGNGLSIVKEDKLSKDIIGAYTRTLSPFSKKKLATILARKEKRPLLAAECFVPHHGIVFWDKEEKIIGHLSICFHCNNYRVIPRNLYTEFLNLEALEQLFKKQAIPVMDDIKDYQQFLNSKQEKHLEVEE